MKNLEQLACEVEKPIPNIERRKFQPKHKDIPQLSGYSEIPEDGFWDKFPHLSWERGKEIKSSVDPLKLFRMATKSNYPDMATVIEIVEDIKHGCDICCRGVNLCPSVSSNAPTAYENGEKVTDSTMGSKF